MSQPGPPEQGRPRPNRQQESPGTLDQAAQQNLIQELGRAVLRAIPPSWQEVGVEYRAAGGFSEITAHLVAPNGTHVPLSAPAEVGTMFARLRHGMHEPDRGTWISAIYRLQRPSSYSVDFNGDSEPDWRTPPPDAAFAEELRQYPRAAANIPGWLQRRAGTPDAGSSATRMPALRTAEVFDSVDGDGRPRTNRPEVVPAEFDGIIDYLDRAPIVRAGSGYDIDRLDPEQPAAVPMSFHTDGRWVWSGAVSYYLRRHGVPPEADLIAHIRQADFRLPEVDAQACELATSLINGAEPG